MYPAESSGQTPDSEDEVPQGDMEELVASVWTTVLG